MKSLVEKGGVKDDESDENGGGGELLCDSVEEECEESSSSFETLSTEEKQCNGNCDCHELMGSASVSVSKDEKAHVEDEKPKASVSDIDMMKERFSKLLLGEDMSGSGQGACTALAISNAITNLSATIFGQLWRLEPLRIDKKSMWQREMEWLLCVSDHIVEFKPSWQTFPNGSKLEVMTCRQRSDLNINIPALRKLDNMLLEILDSFHDSDFWYVDKGISGSDSDGSTSSRKSTQRQEDKWWLPLPHVPHGGLQESSRKKLQHKRECTNQILKAAVAINSNSLAEMAVPQSYIDSLPKYGRESLGDVMYRYITSDKFSPDHILDRLQFSSEHQVLEIANRVEASIYVWRQITQRTIPKPPRGTTRDKTVSTEKRVLFADRAEGLLMCLKNRFPGLPQTSLDTSKIQFNKDVGKSILESYSRVLESLAFNIVARIDDILYIDDLAKQSEVPPFSSVAKKGALIAYSNNNINRSSLPSPSRGSVREDRYPLTIRTASARSLTVKKVLNDYLS